MNRMFGLNHALPLVLRKAAVLASLPITSQCASGGAALCSFCLLVLQVIQMPFLRLQIFLEGNPCNLEQFGPDDYPGVGLDPQRGGIEMPKVWRTRMNR